jgi:hypothetical protein
MWLIDSNVLIDVLGSDPRWYDWSSTMLARAADRSGVVINPVIYAEVAAGFRHVEPLEAGLAWLGIELVEIPRAALFLAGQQFRSYRARSIAPRTSLLPDFLVGAHAAVDRLPLLTRDVRRYRTWFPTVSLITP